MGPGEKYDVPLHLVLFSLNPPAEASAALEVVRGALQRSPNPRGEVEEMLSDTNWRPHVIGAVALREMSVELRKPELLWRTLDAFSWASPQVAAVGCLVDPAFEDNARRRILARCEIKAGQWAQAAPLPPRYDAKLMAALVALVRERFRSPAWLQEAIGLAETQNVLQQDKDGGEIALKWLAALEALI